MERKYTYTTRNSERTSSKKNNEVPAKKSLSHTKPPILEEITGQKLSTGVHPWLEKWLKGEEYYEMISDYRFYSEVFGFRIYDKMPDSIYLTPQNGMIFYLRGYKLEDVNFPRQQELKKIYKWKKMNFITHLPKNNPKVSYLVASTTFTDNEQISFRMHFVVPYDNCNDLMLCHILQIYPRPNSIISSPQVSEQNVNNPEEMSWVFPENARITAEENPEKPMEIKLEDFTVKQEYNESFSYQDQSALDPDYIPPFEDKPYSNTRSNSRNRSKSKKSLQQNPVSAVPKYHDQDDLVDYSQNYDKTKGDYYNPNKNPMRAFMCAKLLFP